MNGGEWDEGEGEGCRCAVECGEADAVDGDEAFFDDVSAYRLVAFDG